MHSPKQQVSHILFLAVDAVSLLKTAQYESLSIQVMDSYFNDNAAISHGSSTQLSGVSFADGGAIFVLSAFKSVVEIHNTSFTGNNAQINSVQRSEEGEPEQISLSLHSAGEADPPRNGAARGGAVSVVASTELTVTGVKMFSNTVDSGGEPSLAAGLYVEEVRHFCLNSSDFHGNEVNRLTDTGHDGDSTGGGGAIAVLSVFAGALRNISVFDNSVAGDGGAIWSDLCR